MLGSRRSPRPGRTCSAHRTDRHRSRSERASVVQEAAEHARGRGAPLAAAELWELSAELTPRDDEPRLCSRTRSAALERFDAGDVGGARARLETLIRDFLPSATSADAGGARGQVLQRRGSGGRSPPRRAPGCRRRRVLQVDHPRESRVGGAVSIRAGARGRSRPCGDQARRASNGADRAPCRARRPRRGRSLLGLETEPTMRRASAIDVHLAPGETVHPARIRGEPAAPGREDRGGMAIGPAGGSPSRRNRARAHASRHAAAAQRGGMRGWGLGRGRPSRGRGIRHRRRCGPGGDPRSDAVREGARSRPHGARGRGPRGRNRGGLPRCGPGGTLGGGGASQRAGVPRAVDGRSRRGCSRPRSRRSGSWPAAGSPSRERSRSSPTSPKPWCPSAGSIARRRWWIGCRTRAPPSTGRSPWPRRRDAARSSRRVWAIRQGALLELEGALAIHERIAIPFESARTRLIHGETLRRMKRKREARDSLERARSQFDSSGRRCGGREPTARWRGSEAAPPHRRS